MQRLGIVLATASLIAACSGLDTEPGPDAAAAPLQQQVTTTSVPPDTTTTAPPTTTTTTVPPPIVVFAMDTRPVAADVLLETADGRTITTTTPFVGQLAEGPASAVLNAPGHNVLALDLEISDGGSLSVWLDKEGQLVHKLSEFDTGAAPKQVAFTPDGSELWVTLLGGKGFEVYDPLTGVLLAEVDLPQAGSVEVIFDEAGDRAFISQMETASVYEVDASTKEVVRRMSTRSSWTKVMVLSPDESTLYASNWLGNDVSEIDLETGETVRRIPTVQTPRGLYVTPDGQTLYVAGFEDGDIQVIDLETGTGPVIYRSGGAMRHFAPSPDGTYLYASDMGRDVVLQVDTATNEVTELAAVDRLPNTIDLDPEGRVLYVSNRGRNNPETYYKPGPEWGTVVLVDVATGARLDAIVGGNQTTGLDVSPDGSMLAYSDFLDDRVTVYSIPPYEVLVAGGGGRWDEHLVELQK